MKRIFIVGGNGYAKECYYILKRVINISDDIIFGGFIGHGGYGDSIDFKDLQKFYKGDIEDFSFEENDYCIIGAGYPSLRKKIYKDLKSLHCKLYNLISPDVYAFSDISSLNIGEGNIIVNKSSISINLEIGNGNVLNGDVIIGHDCQIGDFNFFGPRSQALGNVKVGNMNTIGANAILLPNSKIGDNNKIAPLSAIYKGCKNNCYMSGNPALKVGVIEED